MQMPDFSKIEIKDYEPIKRVLDNGIKTYCFANHDSEAVFIKFVFYNAGTISQDKFFVSTLTKTQLNKNTKDYTYKELADEIDFFGLSYSPLTSNERTTLGFSFLSRYTKDIMPLLQQIILYPRFTQDTLDTTISNLRQNYLLKLQQTNFLAQKYFVQQLYGEDNPYGNSAKVEDYDKVTKEDLKDFWQRYYSSDQCYILLAGDIQEDFYGLLNTYFGKAFNVQENGLKALKNIAPFKDGKGIIRNSLSSAVQSSIVIGRIMPKVDSEDFIPLTVLNCLFGGYFNSRLMSNIREEKGYTYGIDSALVPFKYGNTMFIVSDVAMDKTNATIEEVFKEMQRLHHERVSQEELSMVKNYMTGDFLRATDGVSEISENYDYIIRFGLRQDYNSYMLKEIRKIDAERLMFLAQKYLKPEDFLVSVVSKE